MSDRARLIDDLQCALSMARDLSDGCGLIGYGVAQRFDGDGRLLESVPFSNLLTDSGDLYYATKAIAGVGPSATAAPAAVTGMQIGSGVTAASKSGLGAAIGTLLAGQAFDATFPSITNLGAGLGVNAVHRTTYAAGVGTGSVSEVVLTNGVIGTASTAANTMNRALLGTPVTKAAGDSLAVTYNVKFLG